MAHYDTLSDGCKKFYKLRGIDIQDGDGEYIVTNQNDRLVRIWRIPLYPGETKRIAMTQSYPAPIMLEYC